MKNKFYLVGIEYGREMSLDCGNFEPHFISDNKEIIIREFIKGVSDELDYCDVILEDNSMSLEDVERELFNAIVKKQDYTVCFYRNIDDFDSGCELFSYVCRLVERKVK